MDESIKKPIIEYESWDSYLTERKNEILESLSLDKVITLTPEGYKFLNIIGKINDIRLFDLSRISYLAFIFLDNYIGTHLSSIINNTRTQINNTTNNTTNTTNDLDNLLEYIINVIIYIELSLNYHFLLLLNHLARYNSGSNMVNSDVKIARFNKSVKDFHNDVKPASLLLYLMKLIKTVSFIMNSISISSNTTMVNIVSIIRDELIKVNNYLDEFIISINTGSGISGVSGISRLDKYKICIKLVNEMIEIFYNMFDSVYQEIVKILIKMYPDDQIRLNSIGESVRSFIEMEILLIKKKFNVCG